MLLNILGYVSDDGYGSDIFKYTNFGIVSLIHGDFFIRQVTNDIFFHSERLDQSESFSVKRDITKLIVIEPPSSYLRSWKSFPKNRV